MSNLLIPEKLTGFRVYKDGVNQLGVADVTLPNIQGMSENISGAGILGEIDSPVKGHFGPISLSLKWTAVNSDLAALAAPGSHHLDLRGAVQHSDQATGETPVQPVKIVVLGRPKNINLGQLATGKAMGSEVEFEVTYIKVTINYLDKLEIDKVNHVFKVAGVDHMADIRAALGIEGLPT